MDLFDLVLVDLYMILSIPFFNLVITIVGWALSIFNLMIKRVSFSPYFQLLSMKCVGNVNLFLFYRLAHASEIKLYFLVVLEVEYYFVDHFLFNWKCYTNIKLLAKNMCIWWLINVILRTQEVIEPPRFQKRSTLLSQRVWKRVLWEWNPATIWSSDFHIKRSRW